MQALEGVKVIDLARWLPGQYCTMLLADYGADVLRVEPVGGDDTRSFTPTMGNGMSYWHLQLNRGKRSVTLDYRTPEGAELLKKLIARADIVVEGFRPGYLEKIGLGWEALKRINPRVILCSLTGFGQHGALSRKPAHDLNINGLSGLNAIDSGGEVAVSDVQISALGASLNAVTGISMALLARERTGEGQHVDISMYAASLSLEITGLATLFGLRRNGGRAFGRWAHYYNIYKCKDGKFLTIGCIEEKFWQKFCHMAGLDEIIPRHFDYEHQDELAQIIADRIATKTQAESMELTGGEAFCVSPVLSLEEAAQSDIARDGALFEKRMENGLGEVEYIKPAIGLTGTPGKIGHRAPYTGEDNETVYAELGVTKPLLAEYKARKII